MLGATIPSDLQFTDESGQGVFLRQLIDKPTVLTLNYFRCAGICTPQLNDLVRTLNKVALEPGKDFQVVTVSFDSTDTPEIAAGKRTNYLRLLTRPFPPTAWRFLTGDQASILALANAVGFGFKKDRDAFIHPGALIILSPGEKRAALILFLAGTGLGYFLERWGTTRECWTYYTRETPPLFAVLAHGMAAVAFWRAGVLLRVFLGKVRTARLGRGLRTQSEIS